MNLPGTPLTEISLGREGLAYVDSLSCASEYGRRALLNNRH